MTETKKTRAPIMLRVVNDKHGSIVASVVFIADNSFVAEIGRIADGVAQKHPDLTERWTDLMVEIFTAMLEALGYRDLDVQEVVPQEANP